jgi:putative membrane protein
MKNSILSILAIAAMVACKKNETTNVDTSADSTAMTAPADSGMMNNDSATTAAQPAQTHLPLSAIRTKCLPMLLQKAE